MSRKKSMVEPTRGETEILQIIWEHGPSTVRFVNQILNKQKEVQYTSTLKQMQVMTEKGLLTRDENKMTHVYDSTFKEDKVKEYFLEKFVEAFYKGSTSKLIMQLLGNKKTSQDDIEFLKDQLNKMGKQ